MRTNPRLLVAGTALALAACGGPTKTEFPSHHQGLRWTHRAHGEQHAIRHERVALPFDLDPDGTNGTATMLGYLEAIEERGGRFVSDVAIAIQLRHNGAPIECVTQILVEHAAATPPPPPREPDPPAELAAEPEPVYETTIWPWQPGLNQAWVTDRDLVCAKEGVLVTGRAARYEERTAAETARLWATDEPGNPRGPGALPARKIPVAHVMWEARCELHAVRRQVLRYDHYIAARFVPADLARIGREYSDWKLTEAAPLCHPIDVPAGAPLSQRIEAEVYYTGALGRQRQPRIFSN